MTRIELKLLSIHTLELFLARRPSQSRREESLRMGVGGRIIDSIEIVEIIICFSQPFKKKSHTLLPPPSYPHPTP